jgi:site-specific recombinase XerD
MIQNFTVSFQLKKNKTRRDGKAPVYLRITLDGERFENSTHRYTDADSWDPVQQKVRGRNEAAKIINEYLSGLRTDIGRYYNKLSDSGKPISIDSFRRKFKGDRSNQYTILQVFEENNSLVKLEQDQKYAATTVRQYGTTLERLRDFLKKAYNADDLELEKLDINFIRRFEIYLRTEYKIGTNTTMKYLKQLKKVVHYAMELGYLGRDPFFGYKTAFKEVSRGYLTAEELKRIETKKLHIKRLDQVRDIFVFVCYTGFSYSDLKILTPESVVKGIDGKNWIIYERGKTGVRASIKILPTAQAIIDKYKNDPVCVINNQLLPVKSNQKLNSYLSELTALCEIDKHITMHLGRHTFATTVTLTNGVPIETVQKMLGHKNLSTTQIYSKVVDTKISEDMEKLSKKIG